MFSCTTREVACQEFMRRVMLLKGTEVYHNLQMFLTISISLHALTKVNALRRVSSTQTLDTLVVERIRVII